MSVPKPLAGPEVVRPFEIGKKYHRRTDVHGRFGGQMQGGISTPADYPLIFLFTGASGETYGYEDRFRADGTFWYTGEGQRGDMAMARGNLAIRDHSARGKTMHLFETAERAWVRYIGEATYIQHHLADMPDADGALRTGIVFELDLTYPGRPGSGTMEVRDRVSGRDLWKKSLEELRDLALKGPAEGAEPAERRQISYVRSEAVRVYVLKRANGICEACDRPAPFETAKGRPYLEPHHTQRVADGGPDHPRWVAAICPNCHREIHHGKGGDALNERLKKRLRRLEQE